MTQAICVGVFHLVDVSPYFLCLTHLQLMHQVYLVNGVGGQNVIVRPVKHELEWPAIVIRPPSPTVPVQARLRLRHSHVHRHAVSYGHGHEAKRLHQ